MTLPQEEYLSLINSRKFLLELLDPKKTPKVPKKVRLQARNCLKHFPFEIVIKKKWKIN
jgi:hypothetical protein